MSSLLLILAALLLSSTTSFTLPSPAIKPLCSSLMWNPCPIRPGVKSRPNIGTRSIVSLAAANNGDDGESKKLPFFARVVNKVLRKKDGEEVSAVSTVENETKTEATATAAALSSAATVQTQKKADDDVTSPAMMMAIATRTRLEAERDQLLLTINKIEKLEGKLVSLNNAADGNEKKRSEILKDIALMAGRLGPVKSTVNTIASVLDSVADEKVQSDNSASKETNQTLEEAILTQTSLTPEQLADAITAFEKLPPPLKDLTAKTVGLPNGQNATAVITALISQNRLTPNTDGEKFTFSTTLDSQNLDPSDIEIFVDPTFIERNAFVNSLLPECTRKFPLEEELASNFTKILGMDTFNPSGKAESVPGGCIVRGENRVKSQEGRDDGDLLIEAIDKKLSGSDLAKRVNYYYILDPTPASGEDILNEEDEMPVLLITNSDIAPSTDVWVKPLVTLIALASVAGFAMGTFAMNNDVVSQVERVAEEGGDLNWLVDLSLPVGVGVLGVQLVHEMGHWVVALKDGVSCL